MNFEIEGLSILKDAVARMEAGFTQLPRYERKIDMEDLRAALMEAADRMQDNYPYHHPLYAGQMIKPPHPVARLAYTLSLWLNPNNHALDGGRASSAMEKEAVTGIANMFGWKSHLGHLCGGGTMANLEALWVSGLLKPGRKIAASEQAHYTHSRISDVLKLPFEVIPCDRTARMDMNALEERLKQGEIGTVVATIGTTAMGSVDPLQDIIPLREKYGFRIHADAAYGGYFTLVDNLDDVTRRAFDCLGAVDSIAVDPHKHGLQPYGCGCILFRDPAVGQLYKHDSPYTYFTSNDLHLGEISLECSRPGATAVALWTTQRLLPLVPGGEFAAGLAQSRQAALALSDRLDADPRFRTIIRPELDIIVWIPFAGTISELSALSRKLFADAAEKDLHLAVATFKPEFILQNCPDITPDLDQVTCLRSCLMKPEHLEWTERIWQIIDEVA